MVNANELMNELLSFDVAALSQKLRAREVSPVEVTDAYLARIEEVDKKLNAYITVTADVAREAAKRAESEITAGESRGAPAAGAAAPPDARHTKVRPRSGGPRDPTPLIPPVVRTVFQPLAGAA